MKLVKLLVAPFNLVILLSESLERLNINLGLVPSENLPISTPTS